MRSELYPDGVRRINAKIEIPMSDADVSLYILSAIVSENSTLHDIQNLNKRQLLQLAKEEIWRDGAEVPRARAENADRDTKVIIKNYVRMMFPELNQWNQNTNTTGVMREINGFTASRSQTMTGNLIPWLTFMKN